MNSIQTSSVVIFLMIGLFIGKLNAGLVSEPTVKETIKNDKLGEVNQNDNLSKLIDFFNMYDSAMTSSEEKPEHDENLSEQEIDDREIELLMLTLPRMGRYFKDEVPAEVINEELSHLSNNPIKLLRRAIPRFGKRALPRFGKRAIPRLG